MSSGVYDKFTGYHNRKSIRLPGYDYSGQGYYFITICLRDRKQRLFGDIIDKKMVFTELGNIAFNQFEYLPKRFPNIKLDEFQIMPNHVHAVIQIHTPHNSTANIVGATLAVAHDRAGASPAPTKTTVAHDANAVAHDRAGASPAPTEIIKTVKMKTETAETKPENMKTNTIGDIVGAYKSLVANACLKIYKSKNERMGKLWQRNYFEHIIRDNKSLYFIRNYIRENPVNWFVDTENHIEREIHEFEMKEIGEVHAPKSFH
ncbi:MAG: transposase [Chitinivibrionales bacterium]